MAGKLSDRQQRFCEEYIVDLNATQAAIRAGYSPKTAEQQGFQLLKKTSVAECISTLKQARSKRTQVTADRVVKELARVGFFDIRKVATWDNEGVQFIPSDEVDNNSARAIQSVKSKRKTFTTEVGESVTVEIDVKMASKLKALELLGKHLGMFLDNRPSDNEPSEPPIINIEDGTGGNE